MRSNYAVIRIMEHDGASSIFSTGQYCDSVVFEGGTPRFRRRHVVFDSPGVVLSPGTRPILGRLVPAGEQIGTPRRGVGRGGRKHQLA